MRRRRSDSGFTLLEMLVVLVILGLMVGLVVTRGPPRSAALDLRAAAAEMAQALRGARARAIATNRRVDFRLDVAGHVFAVDGGTARALPASLALSMTAASGETVGRTEAIAFAPDGSSTGGRIDVAEGARIMRVEVDWLTGRVRIAEAATDAR
jgi:general secretion pathway protein H